MFCILVFNVAEPLKYSYDCDPSRGLRSLDRDHSTTRDKSVQVLRGVCMGIFELVMAILDSDSPMLSCRACRGPLWLVQVDVTSIT